MNFADKISRPGPKRLLALDGGGIRGLISVEILAAIEKLLQDRLGRGDDFVLADYFDYIAGTSTGGIIATCLAWGMRVSQVRQFYKDNGQTMFDKASLLKRFHYKYDDEALAKKLRNVLSENDVPSTLGSERLKTLLMLVMRNSTTDSPWPICNNPSAKYNDRNRADCNLNLPLWQLVRASTAAPTYFPPEVIDVGKHCFTFVDGGITPYNNPALQLFLMATLSPYQLQWPVGEEKLLLVSVGTGISPAANENLAPGEMNLLYNATSLPSALMFGAQYQQDLLCRALGNCLHGDKLDNEVNDMRGAPGVNHAAKQFTYLRYNAELTIKGLTALKLGHIEPAHVQQLDSTAHIDDLKAVGESVGLQVAAAHFPKVFDC
jgi:uncharacterized protein